MRALHALARAALRVFSPRRAKRVVEEAARALPPFGSVEEARAAAGALDGHGTCLSRALAVSSRLAGSHVVIGVEPGMANRSLLHAHAWVEIDGAPLRANDPRGEEIVRL